MKRLLDTTLSFTLFIATFPILLLAMIAVYLQDGKNPIYSPFRIGKDGVPFRMYKLRTMVVGADKNKVDTTAQNDPRITKVGHFLRRYKLDELPQLWNVLLGQMSMVGPRPQIDREVSLYTETEKELLKCRPGITDLSSIIFSDLAEIVATASDPNIAYNQLVRPWKSRLGLFYIAHSSMLLDMAIIMLTIVAILSKKKAFSGVCWLLGKLNAPDELVAICRRDSKLIPTPPPGSFQVVTERGEA